jgi:hypothetical protein
VDFAIIVRKYADGSAETMRSTKHPPTTELNAQARELDRYLHTKLSKVESSLAAKGLLSKEISEGDSKVGSVEVWYALGRELRTICEKLQISNQRERQWLWEAIHNLHASSRIKRVERRRGRNHFEYCYRVAGFPKIVAAKLNWGEWVYFFDSLTVRQESRADDWLTKKAKAGNVDRRLLRRLTQNLNRRIRKMDTSVLEDDELFAIYNKVWVITQKEISGEADIG